MCILWFVVCSHWQLLSFSHTHRKEGRVERERGEGERWRGRERRKGNETPSFSVLYILHALPRYLSPTCLAMSSWVEREFSQVWDCCHLFYQQPVPYFHMKYYSRQEILPGSGETIGVGINDLQVHICNNANTGRGSWEQDLMTSLMLPQITPRSSTMYEPGKDAQENVKVRVDCLQHL